MYSPRDLAAKIWGLHEVLWNWLNLVLWTPDIRYRINQCRGIADISFLASGSIGGTGTDLGSRLALRAKANQQLVDTLGIHNSLTTADPNIHKAFLRQATQHLMRMATPEHWQTLYGYCQGRLEQAVADHQLVHSRIRLATLVRRLCLESVMQVLFQAVDLDKDDLDTVCDEINEQWVLSKTAKLSLQSSSETGHQSSRLISALCRLLKHGEKPDTAPLQALNLIIPSYEALWRVVLLTYVTVCYRRCSPSVSHHQWDIAKTASIIGTGSLYEKKLRGIAREGLRLFPSSKRIYRAQSLSAADTSMIAANVSALHRDIDIWGADAMAFRPDRFDVNMSTEQKQAYLPFGLTPHLCPAFHGFGERIILLLVALLSARLGPKTATIKYNDAQPDANLDSELPTGRYDMEDWALYLRMGDKTNEYHQK